jgi:hypothetical protein
VEVEGADAPDWESQKNADEEASEEA